MCFSIVAVFTFKPAFANEQLKVLSFDIVPLTCVTKFKGQECKMKVNLKWQLNQKANICFYQDAVQMACWKGKLQHSQNFQIKLVENTEFSLRTTETNQVIAKQNIKINFVNQYRRRLRPQWSIF